MELISAKETRNTQVLVDQANENGNYVEIEDTTQAREAYRKSRPKRGSGIGSTRRLKGKVHIYHFAYDDHPHMLEAFEHRDNAKHHMFRDVYFAAARFADQR